MNRFRAAYINELYKLSKKKKITVAAILSVAAVCIGGLIVLGVNNFIGINVTGKSEFAILVLHVLCYTLIPLFTMFVCIDMFTGELAEHTIKQTLTRPVSRLKIFSAKALAAGTFLLSDLLFVMIVSVLISVFIGATSLGIGKVILAYLAEFFPLAVFALLVIFVANALRSTAAAFLISLVCYLVLLGLSVTFSQYQSFFIVSFFDWYTLFLGSYLNLYKILRVLLIFFGCGIMFFAAGYYLYDRRDI